MWGWRARIGFIVVASELVQEHDMFRMAPKGVSVHFTRKPFRQPWTVQDLVLLSQDLGDYVQLLTPVNPDVIVFGDTSASFVGGPGYDQSIIESMKRVCDVKATTTASSVVAAMRALGLKRISVLSPYKHEVNERLVRFFEGNGFKILKMKELELDLDAEITAVPPERIYQYAREADVPKAEGLFITCTGLRGLDAIEDLEPDLGKPVVTSNQATMWNSLRMAGIKDKIEGYGQLFKRF
jgi:maleate isomerase